MSRRALTEEEKEEAKLRREEYRRLYYLKNKEKMIESSKRSYQKNKGTEEFKEKRKQYSYNHYHKNIEKMREYNKARNKIDYERHREKRKKTRREKYKNGEFLKLLKNNQKVECNGQIYYHITKSSLQKHNDLLEGKEIIMLKNKLYIKL